MRAVIADHRTADIDEKLRAMLVFLETLVLEPDAVTTKHARTVLDAGVSPRAMQDAVYVAYLFTQYNRAADALGFALETKAAIAASVKTLLSRGYR